LILSVIPDSGAVVEDFDDAIQVQFNEVIDERSGSGLENLVVLSPRPEELEVSWKRSRITVEPKEGWHENIVYQLTLLPGFADLRNNRLDSSRTVVFSTGGEIPDTRMAGTVIDWEAGRVASRALIEAILLPDSLVYLANADSVGDFQIQHLSPGSYLVFATVDQNNNRQRDSREVFDSLRVRLDSTVSRVMWAFAHDTLGPRISGIVELDSVTIKVDFGQKLVPQEPHDSLVNVYSLPDTTLLEIVAVWNQVTYDSVRTVEAVEDSIRQAAIADSIRVAEAAADTTGADTTAAQVADTTVAEEVEAAGVADSIVEGLLQVVDSANQGFGDSAAVDTSRAALLLADRPQLSSSWYVRLAAGTEPGARYLITALAENVSGAFAESQSLLILPEPVDTNQVPADTT
jgi:hypothetical protein